MKRKTKQVLKTLVLSALGIGAVVGAASGINALVEKNDTELKTIYPVFEVGGLNETDGKYELSETTLYTKDAFECQGLEIKLDFDNTIKYQVFFYESDGDFISSTTIFDGNAKMEVPTLGTHARIELTPNWAEMGEDYEEEENQIVKWYETTKYASQIEVKVNKEQKALNIPYQGEDKFEYSEKVAFAYSGGMSTFYLKDHGEGAYNAIDAVSVVGCKNICIKINKNLIENVKMVALLGDSYDLDTRLNQLDYKESTFGGDFYITLRVDEDWKSVFLYADNTIDFSNCAIYVW